MKRLIPLLLLTPFAHAEPLIIDGQAVDSGCVWELITQLNGDDVVASVSISRTPMRGCQDSNRSAAEEFSYSVYKELGRDMYVLRTVEIVHGSMGHSDSYIIVHIHKIPRVVWTDEGSERHQITVMTKWGEIWGDEGLNAFLEDFAKRQGEPQ